MKGRVFITISLFVFTIMAAIAQPVLVKEIPVNSTNFVKVNNLVFFISGDSLLRTDGTAAGTVFLKSRFNNPAYLKAFNGILYFLNDISPVEYDYSFKELWRSDGTAAGTFLLKKSNAYNVSMVGDEGDFLYFAASDAATGYELYKTNGTVAGTSILKDINPGTKQGFIGGAATSGNNFFFGADDGVHGVELWKTDGSSGGTVLVKDINPGIASGYIISTESRLNKVLVQNQILYFTGNNGVNGAEPFKSDGTLAGTSLIKDIIPGASSPTNINFEITYNGYICITVFLDYQDYPNYWPVELWRTQGTSATTTLIRNIANYGDEAYYHDFRIYKNKIYFFENVSGSENLWVTDGTSQGTFEFFPIRTESGQIPFFEVVNDYMFFWGTDDATPTGFYKSDGTTAGTKVFTRFNSGGYVSFPRTTTKIGNLIFYGDHDGPGSNGSPDNPADYYQLIQTDGNERNVKSVRKIFGGTFAGTDNIIDYNGKVMFTTLNDQYGSSDRKKRLWIYDPLKPATNVPYFTLVDAGTDKDIQWLKQYDTIYKSQGQSFNIRYNYITKPGSVVMKLADTVRKTENGEPYALAGDNSGNYSPWLEGNQGAHKLTAIPYSLADGKGTAGAALTVNFYIKDYIPNRPPIVNAGPDKIITLPKDSVHIFTKVSDPDGDPIKYNSLILVSGPNEPWYDPYSGNPFVITDLMEGEYIFRFTAYDNFNTYSSDEVKVMVKKTSVPSVDSFTMLNADTDQDLWAEISDGSDFYLEVLPANINIRANTSPSLVGKVVFVYDGKTISEGLAPYALFGDNSGDYRPGKLTLGSHTLSATAYSSSGVAGPTYTIHFQVKQSLDQPPTVNAGSDKIVSLPQNSIVLNGTATDPEGSPVTLLWTKISGPSVTMSGVNTLNLQLTNLLEGLYVFRLTATDQPLGYQAYDEVNVTVQKSGHITFTLVNADTDTDISPLVDGQTINLNSIGTNALSIRANSSMAGTKSIVFDFNGKIKYRVENSAPYSLFGDNSGNYTSFGFSSGTYTLKATPFTNTNGGGTAGIPLAITFFVTGTQPFPLVSTSPNPVTDKMKVAFSDEISETAYVSIYDQTGKEYYSGMNEKIDGEFDVDLSDLKLQSGLYLVKIQSSDGRFKVVRIVKE